MNVSRFSISRFSRRHVRVPGGRTVEEDRENREEEEEEEKGGGEEEEEGM